MTTINMAHEAQLRNFTQISVEIDSEYGVAWVVQSPRPRPCYNRTIVNELRMLQMMLSANEANLPYRGENVKINYLVLDSNIDGIFSLGGDLNFFRHCVINNKKEELSSYARECIDTIYNFILGCSKDVTTISLVRGEAMGGGFEVALSCNVIIAEEHISMGFPEILYNIYPGMGGYHLLSQRIPMKQVEKMMLSGGKYSAEELSRIGVVDKLVATGKGREAVYSYIKECNKHRLGYLALKKISDKVNNLSHQALIDVCNDWVNATMQVSERDLRRMDKTVRLQDKLMSKFQVIEEEVRNIA